MNQDVVARKYLDNFGSERADNDYARSVDDDDIFLETAQVSEFLGRFPDYSYVLGTMGMGKSILLLKKWNTVQREKQGIVLAPSTAGRVYSPSVSFANTVRMTSFWQLQRKSGQQDVTAWTHLWEWALLGSVFSHWRKQETDGKVSPVSQRLDEFLNAPHVMADPFESIASYLDVTTDARVEAMGRLSLPDPRGMREFMEQNANDYPPVYMFLDNQDDFFNDSPDFWTASALGCKFAIDQIHRRSDHRIHMTMTLRPEILWRTEFDADATRHRSDVFRMSWSRQDLMNMFTRRASKLKDDLLAEPSLREKSPLGAFFGPQLFGRSGPHDLVIQNCGLGTDQPMEEPLDRYLCRHTLGRPREMILIGNEILARRMAAPAGARFSQEVVRDAVGRAAHAIALAYIGEVKHRWPWAKEGETSEHALRRFIGDFLTQNVISSGDIEVIEKKYLRSCGSVKGEQDAGPFSVLASAGLVGWVVKDNDNVGLRKQYFPEPGLERSVRVPGSVREILLHPVLYGYEFNIDPGRRGVVVGPDELWP